jgi:hypothetical protein
MRIFFALLLLATPAIAADLLPVPKPSGPPAGCMSATYNPAPGQVLVTDKRCKSGLRWKNPLG